MKKMVTKVKNKKKQGHYISRVRGGGSVSGGMMKLDTFVDPRT
jgi:hypothetical protein